MKNFLFLFCFLFLLSCGRNGRDGVDGSDGATTFGVNGLSTGVDFEDISPGLACENGGISVYTFRDHNSDGYLQSGEEILRVKALCHGTHGSDAVISVESVAQSSACSAGGVKITSGASSVEICHGPQGAPGLAGEDGTLITPVKFCTDDKSTHPEYGLIIGGELFAVYWGVTPGSPSAPQAFLTKLVAGNYRSTGGNNCLFEIK